MTLCKSAGSAIQLFHIHYRKYFATILNSAVYLCTNSAVYLSSARVSMFHTLVPLLLIMFKGAAISIISIYLHLKAVVFKSRLNRGALKLLVW